jgi:exodeoxyribonuclease V alpha subunit
MAKRIVAKFGKSTLDIIETEGKRLLEVEGIGKKRLEMIRGAWADHKEIREVMIFLQSHGVSSGYATKIFKQYGGSAISVVQANPYRLAHEIHGIGFITADKIAEKLGFDKNSAVRIQAGILYVLSQMSDEGHVYYPHAMLVEKCAEILDVGPGPIGEAMGAIAAEKRIILEPLSGDDPAGHDMAVYLDLFYYCERSIAVKINELVRSPVALPPLDIGTAISQAQASLSMQLAHEQKKAVRWALENRVLVITGGPGTGKTTIIKAVLTLFQRLKLKVLQAAPTGRAAKRMGEATEHEARTIHRLLEFSFKSGGFEKNAEKPLNCDVLIVDEASMVDTLLMHHLLKAVPPDARLVLVGDVNQLPSVGPGNVLNDIISSGVVPVVALTEIFRQARESRIIVNAHKINHGKLPDIRGAGSKSDFYFRERETPEEALEFIIELATDHIPRVFGLDPVDDIQVLTPMHRGLAGATNLNKELQNALNPRPDDLVRGDRAFRVNDKVMQVRNNYDKDVFNGDIGRIRRISTELQEIVITFDGRDVTFDFADLDEVVLAYAVSVHKAQGSEYPAVILPVLTQHYILLQRNLIYTAVTRGKQLVIMVGTPKALAIAVHNNKPQQRYTRLKHRLQHPDAITP